VGFAGVTVPEAQITPRERGGTSMLLGLEGVSCSSVAMCLFLYVYVDKSREVDISNKFLGTVPEDCKYISLSPVPEALKSDTKELGLVTNVRVFELTLGVSIDKDDCLRVSTKSQSSSRINKLSIMETCLGYQGMADPCAQT
jgi:hypothetical protein